MREVLILGGLSLLEYKHCNILRLIVVHRPADVTVGTYSVLLDRARNFFPFSFLRLLLRFPAEKGNINTHVKYMNAMYTLSYHFFVQAIVVVAVSFKLGRRFVKQQMDFIFQLCRGTFAQMFCKQRFA